MKEKSKSAARTRREKENCEYTDLAKLLPLPWAITAQLDKASIIRLSASYLQLRIAFQEVFPSFHAVPLTSVTHCQYQLKELGSHLMQGLEGFVFVLAPDGKVMYVSETASVHLGLSQVELTGNYIFDYLYEKDIEEMKHLLQPYLESAALERLNKSNYPVNPGKPELKSICKIFRQCKMFILRQYRTLYVKDEGKNECRQLDFELERSFIIRLRCVLAKRNAGLTCQLDGNMYKIVHCFGFLKMKLWSGSEVIPSYQHAGLVAMATTLPHGSAIETRLPSWTFLFRASLDFKIIFLDTRVAEITGFAHFELLDRSIYNFVHVCDISSLKTAHQTLLAKRQSISAYYRFLAKEGGWLWVQSHFSIVENPRASRPLCIVCINTVISQIEARHCLLVEQQSQFSAKPNTIYSEEGAGVYSKEFYGPNGMLLLQQSPKEFSIYKEKYSFDDKTAEEKRYFLKSQCSTDTVIHCSL